MSLNSELPRTQISNWDRMTDFTPDAVHGGRNFNIIPLLVTDKLFENPTKIFMDHREEPDPGVDPSRGPVPE